MDPAGAFQLNSLANMNVPLLMSEEATDDATNRFASQIESTLRSYLVLYSEFAQAPRGYDK